MYYIYKIENIKNNKKYIGLTGNIEKRKRDHFAQLKHGYHCNKFLQKEYDEYGADAFSFEIVFSGDVSYDEISNKEREYIAYYDSYSNGYNQNEGGNFGPSNGGSKLIAKDVFNILAVSEFTDRSGEVLGEIFGVTRTTIGRLKKGESHKKEYDIYWSKSLDERKNIYNTFCENNPDIFLKLESNHGLEKIRKFNKEEVFTIISARHISHISDRVIAKKFGVNKNAIVGIRDRKFYKDYWLEYDNLTDEEKQTYASLFCEE